MSLYYAPTDCETGGLDPKKSDLLTWYMAIMDESFNIVEEINLKLKPDNNRLPIVEAGAMRVNGINLEQHLADPETITYSEAFVKAVAMLEKYSKRIGRTLNISVLGHNVPFDVGFVQHHIMPKEVWDKFFHYDLVDTKAYVRLFKDAGWFPKDIGTLTSLVDFLGVPKRAAHNAKEDTLMTVDAYKELVNRMKAKKDAGGEKQDLISLLEQE